MKLPTTLLALALCLVRAQALSVSRNQHHLRVNAADESADGNDYLNAHLPGNIFHQAAQYAARYTVPSSLPDDVPSGCKVTLVNSLERHGARYMTSGSLKSSSQTLAKIQKALKAPNVTAEKLSPELRFLVDAQQPTQETADLNPYGALQAYHSGRFTRDHYRDLAQSSAKPFARTTGDPELGDDRVVVTAQYWLLGYSGEPFPAETLVNGTQVRASSSIHAHQPDVIISEQDGRNNTLDVGTCEADETYDKKFGEDGAVKLYGQSTLEPVIASRLQRAFAQSGAAVNLTYTDIQSLANLCFFETLNSGHVHDGGKLDIALSPYCKVFRSKEWELVGYALDAGKYYGSGYGDPYHRALGTGYLRELLSRLTSTAPVLSPPTSQNTTLDGSSSTFPVPSKSSNSNEPHIFFDGSHDNNISPIVAAFGLFYSAQNLSLAANAESTPEGRERKWRFSQIAPLQGKVVWEKLQCGEGEYVRVRVNEAIQKAAGKPWCPAAGDARKAAHHEQALLNKGLCPLANVVRSLEWVKSGDEWSKCYN